MGGKRELRRCVSLSEDSDIIVAPQKLLQPLSSPTQPAQPPHLRALHADHQVPAVCPIVIRIDDEECHCSDKRDKQEGDDEHPAEVVVKNNHVTKPTNHRTPSPSVTLAPHERGFPTGRCEHPAGDECLPYFPIPSSCSSSSSSSSLSSSQTAITPVSPSFLQLPDSSELSVLKATARRLQLRTRSSSFMEWQSLWLDKASTPPQFPIPAEAERGVQGRLTTERKERINHALDWLKSELREMQSMDQHLARQLLSLRQDIHQLRLRRSCQEHRDLLDDVQSELAERGELSDILDLPNDLSLNDTPLGQIGVTRMNISARRFSTC